MPLNKGAKAKTKAGKSENMRRLVKEGYPTKQAAAIMYSEAGEAGQARKLKGKRK